MMNISDKRKHFRFPAYDDEAGVKLNRRHAQNQFFNGQQGSNNMRTERNQNIILDPVEIVGAPDYFGQDGLPNMRTERAVPKQHTQPIVRMEKSAYTQKNLTKRPVEMATTTIQDEPVVEEDFAVRQLNNQQYVEPKKQDYKSPQSTFSNKLYDADYSGRAKYKKREHRSVKFESSYSLPGENKKTIFKPKHIPVSMIEEEVEPVITQNEKDEVMMDLLKLTKDNLMMIVEENNFDEVEIVDVDKKKQSRLEKSLTSIMEDEASDHLNNNYFDK